MTDIGRHPRGERVDVGGHACPDCPTPLTASPLTGGLWVPPNPFCQWCRGTGLVTTEDLARWQAHALAGA